MACAVQVKPLQSHLDPEFAIKRTYRAGFWAHLNRYTFSRQLAAEFLFYHSNKRGSPNHCKHIATHYKTLQHVKYCVTYSRSHLGWHFRMLFQSWKLKAPTSLLTEMWQKRRSSFELWAFENVTPSGIGCNNRDVQNVKCIYWYIYACIGIFMCLERRTSIHITHKDS